MIQFQVTFAEDEGWVEVPFAVGGVWRVRAQLSQDCLLKRSPFFHWVVPESLSKYNSLYVPPPPRDPLYIPCSNIPDFPSVCPRVLVMGKVSDDLVSWHLWEKGLWSLSSLWAIHAITLWQGTALLCSRRLSKEPILFIVVPKTAVSVCARPVSSSTSSLYVPNRHCNKVTTSKKGHRAKASVGRLMTPGIWVGWGSCHLTHLSTMVVFGVEHLKQVRASKASLVFKTKKFHWCCAYLQVGDG